jgi:HSP20 family molecular chaperone IbpA
VVYSESYADQLLAYRGIVDLPASVDAEKATATLKNGVLELVLPKVAKAKMIEIKPKTG